MENPIYSVIVPVYNSQDTLKELLNRIETTLLNIGKPFEILLIDDFSLDDSWNVLKNLKAGRPHIRLIRLTKNFGQASAVLCGVREAAGKTMITIDDDLQYPPEEIGKLIHHFNPQEKYILFGVPKKKEESGAIRFFSYVIECFLNKFVTQGKERLRFSSFQIFTKKQFDTGNYNVEKIRSPQVFFTMVSPKLMDWVEVLHEKRKKGRSTYSILKKIKVALHIFLVNTEVSIYLFITSLLIAIPLLISFSILLIFGFNLEVSNFTILTVILTCAVLFSLGFIFLLIYLRSIFLQTIGSEAYAIWEEV